MDKDENTNYVETVRDLAFAAVAPITHEVEPGRPEEVMLLPPGYTVANLDGRRKLPRRVEVSKTLQSLDSFIEYINEFKQAGTAIFGDREGHTISCTIDYHDVNPDWCAHKVTLVNKPSTAWQIWTTNNKQRKTQRAFLHFIQDNIQDITDPDHATLIEEIKNVKIGKKGSREIKISHSSESSNKNSDIEVTSGLPEFLSLAIEPWRHSKHYALLARVYMHIENDEVQYSYQLINPDRIIDHIFQDYIGEIEAATSIATYV